jgi:hypothetical protein
MEKNVSATSVDAGAKITDYDRFVGAFALLHAMVFAFGFMNYYLKVEHHRLFPRCRI